VVSSRGRLLLNIGSEPQRTQTFGFVTSQYPYWIRNILHRTSEPYPHATLNAF